MGFLITQTGGGSLTYKDAVRTASSANVPLTGSAPIIVGGVSLNDKDRVLLKNQGTASQNGIYTIAISGGTYTLTRSTDCNTSKEMVPNMLVPVSEGTSADQYFQLTTNAPIILGTTALVFDYAAVYDHGLLIGLGDDDHTQYLNTTRAKTWFDTDYLKQTVTNGSTATVPSEDAVFDHVASATSNLANRSLSNLTSPTALNQNLLFAKTAAQVEADNTQTTIANATLVIKAGDSTLNNRGQLYLQVRSNNGALSYPVGGLNIDPNVTRSYDTAIDFNFSPGNGRFFKLKVDSGNVTNKAEMWQGGHKFFDISHSGADINQLQLLTGSIARLTITDTTSVFSNLVQGSNGTVSTPAYSFSGDTNTGMYWIAADTLGFSTNGVEAIRVTTTSTVLNSGLNIKSRHAQTGTVTGSVSDIYIGCDSSGGAVTVNLPTASSSGAGKKLIIKDEGGNATTNNISIVGNGSDVIDGSGTQSLVVNYESVTLVCDGVSKWFII